MTAFRRIPIDKQPGKTIIVEDGATRGAQFGTNLYGEDGALLTIDQLVALAAGAVAVPSGQTAWPTILDVPPNVQQVAALATNGYTVRKADGTWVTRSVDGVAGETTSTNEDGESGNTAIGLADVGLAAAFGLYVTEIDTKGRVIDYGPAEGSDLAVDDVSWTIISGDDVQDALDSTDDALDLLHTILALAGIGEAAGVVVTDLNIPLTTKFMVFSFGVSTTNAPATSVGNGVHMRGSATDATQVVVSAAGRIFFRVATASVYGAWQELNKRNPGINSAATGAITPNWRNNDLYARTALAAPTAINAPGAGNEGADGQLVGFVLRDDGTPRALTWDAVYTGSNKPATTIVGETIWVWFRRNAALSTYEFQFTSNASGGGGGAVSSVNGYTGAVVLAAVDVGCWTTVAKAASTARTATAVLASDPDLTVPLAVGKYVIRSMVHFSAANATMDFKYGLNFTGTATSYMTREFIAPGGAGTSGASQAAFTPMTASEAVTSTSAGYGSVAYEIVIDVTVAGTFAFQWAQNTSDLAALTVLFGSNLEYKKVA